MELEDVLDRGAAEGIDRLVVVTDDGDVAVRLGEGRHERGLRPVRVLELVDEDVAVAPGDQAARAEADSRISCKASETWSPKSMKPLLASRSWYRA